jgi:hypothetical protein
MIPEGTWRARGVTAALGFTSNDSEQVGVDLVFSPDQDEEVDGRHITWYGYFTEKTEATTLKALRALGWASESLADLSGVDTNEVEVVVAYEQGLDGVERARVRWINAIGGGGLAMKSKMSEDQARAFAERMRGKVLATAKAAPPAQPPRAAAAPSGTPAAAAPRQTKGASRKRAGGTAAAAGAGAAPEDDNIPF